MTDFTRTRGDTYPDIFQVINTATGKPQDLTGVTTVRMATDTRKSPSDATTQLYTRVGSVTDPVNGWVSMPMSAPEADHVGKYFHDIEIIDGSGFVRTIDAGKYTFVQDVTKT